ncbi:hypothetical protein [Enterobacillus tribolii]|uniref:Lipoprotein n=1 Tax=Enterobacillus tribolii TaxID=1487935 RepID=A0A370R2E4_9GAMM|nr:hypothetical protein [Enterobacillus tribolii]MBW7982712.1 hypothetical protein [Enterobacillus tribolii]RDK95726.1 hypothetical protein C8D90_102207 [Enterobacillus tribolii]
MNRIFKVTLLALAIGGLAACDSGDKKPETATPPAASSQSASSAPATEEFKGTSETLANGKMTLVVPEGFEAKQSPANSEQMKMKLYSKGDKQFVTVIELSLPAQAGQITDKALEDGMAQMEGSLKAQYPNINFKNKEMITKDGSKFLRFAADIKQGDVNIPMDSFLTIIDGKMISVQSMAQGSDNVSDVADLIWKSVKVKN